jgi:hypothetical protein
MKTAYRVTFGFFITGMAAVLTASEPQTNATGTSTPKPLLVKAIEAASYDQKLDSSQWYSLGWGSLPISGGYGQVTSDGYEDYKQTANPPGHLAIMPVDNKLVESDYTGGELALTLDGGKKVVVLLPKFKDVKGRGFQAADGTPFIDGLYVAADGGTYYDQKLTKPARAK